MDDRGLPKSTIGDKGNYPESRKSSCHLDENIQKYDVPWVW